MKERVSLTMNKKTIMSMHIIEYCSFYTRRISMPKSFNGKKLMYTSIVWLHDLKTLSLNVQWYFHCSGMSNTVSWK